jgi:ectoine hydroxylase-related dioxygenase (phytanoyl-CoA dioxygenase family)
VGLREDGYAIVTDALPVGELATIRERMFRVQAALLDELGEDRLKAAGELGVLRLMMRFDPYFLRLLELPEVVALVDATVSPTAILHLQNGFILPPLGDATPATFQNRLHRDFPRWLNGYLASINLLFAIDAFTEQNGATLVVPGSHRRDEMPESAVVQSQATALECPAGSILLFDSTLWHAAGINRATTHRCAINHQFTRSFFKQQIDYVRALGTQLVSRQPERVQQMLGYFSRVPSGLDEYYRPEADRVYRKHQG